MILVFTFSTIYYVPILSFSQAYMCCPFLVHTVSFWGVLYTTICRDPNFKVNFRPKMSGLALNLLFNECYKLNCSNRDEEISEPPFVHYVHSWGFGLTNAPSAFMDLINRVFHEYIDGLRLLFYLLIDDILIYSPSRDEHEEHLRTALQLLLEYQLYAKYEKCEFWLSDVKFLRRLVSGDGLSVDFLKIEAVTIWRPKNACVWNL